MPCLLIKKGERMIDMVKLATVLCGMTSKPIPPEDAGRCNNAEGCDSCPHNEDE